MAILDRFRLDGKVAIVTGAGRGLGQVMSLALAEAGAHIVAVARTQSQLDETAAQVRERGVRCLTVRCDVADSTQVNDMVRKALDEFGRIDILINNAGTFGTGFGKRLEELTDEEWRQGIDANLTSAFYCARAVAPLMAGQKSGKIINVTSGWGMRAARNLFSYPVAKGGLLQLTKALAITYAQDNVQVNAIAPGLFPHFLPEEQRAGRGRYVPVGRTGEDWELGPLAVFLCSEAANHITGETVVIDGGALTSGIAPTGMEPKLELREVAGG